MVFRLDARIPVLCAAAPDVAADDERAAWLVETGDAAAPDAVAVEHFAAAQPSHPAGCACCAPRGPIAEALRRLFMARAKGPFFSVVRVAASAAGEAAVRDALANDPMIAAWFRVG
jgi:hypothetical protein